MVGNENGPNTVWTNTVQGACCVEGVCLQLQKDLCVIIGGTYLGGDCSDTTCAEPAATGACCVSSGCRVNTEADCTELGGSWTESGSCDDCPASCAGDTNGDGVINITDLLAVIDHWGVCP